MFFFGRGGRLRTDINKAVNAIKAEAKLPKNFRPLHGLRHAYASMLASSGEVDLYTLQKLLTHKSPQMTQRYAHLRDSALKRAATIAAIHDFRPQLPWAFYFFTQAVIHLIAMRTFQKYMKKEGI